MKKRLGEILMEAGIINEGQLQQALEYQSMWGARLGTALVAKGFLSEEMLMRVLGSTLNMPIVDISRIRVPPEIVKIVPGKLAEKYDVIPIALEAKGGGRQTLIIAMADPLNIEAVDQLKFTSGFNIRPVLSTISGIAEALKKYYGVGVGGQFRMGGREMNADNKMTLIQRGGGERTIDLNVSHDLPDEMPIQRAPGSERSVTRPEPTNGPGPSISRSTVRPSPTLSALPTDGGPNEARDEVRALVRLMIKKGFFTKEEFLKELQEVLLY